MGSYVSKGKKPCTGCQCCRQRPRTRNVAVQTTGVITSHQADVSHALGVPTRGSTGGRRLVTHSPGWATTLKYPGAQAAAVTAQHGQVQGVASSSVAPVPDSFRAFANSKRVIPIRRKRCSTAADIVRLSPEQIMAWRQQQESAQRSVEHRPKMTATPFAKRLLALQSQQLRVGALRIGVRGGCSLERTTKTSAKRRRDPDDDEREGKHLRKRVATIWTRLTDFMSSWTYGV